MDSELSISFTFSASFLPLSDKPPVSPFHVQKAIHSFLTLKVPFITHFNLQLLFSQM